MISFHTCNLWLAASRYALLAAFIFTGATATWSGPAVAADAAGGAEREREWIEILESDAPPQEKAITCKRLAVHGSAAAVPAVAKLLTDPDLSSWARIALEAIPDAAADEALRDALAKVDGRLLIGVINSIAVRQDRQATAALSSLVAKPDEGVAAAAALALGRMGNAEAIKALRTAITDSRLKVRSAAARGIVLSAEQQLANGERDHAVQLYDLVREANLPEQRILEATRGAILARGTEGIPLLVETLTAESRGLFGIGIQTAAEMKGPDITEVLVSQFGDTTPQRQLVLIYALADRDDEAVLPAILLAAKNGPNSIRTVAMEVLAEVGDVSCVPTLLAAATEPAAEIAEAAGEALAALPGGEVDRDLAARLPEATGSLRKVLLELVGERRIAARDELLRALQDSDSNIRAAALTALGATVELADLDVLIQAFVAPKSPADASAASKALHTACVRMPDREACAGHLVAALSEASPETQGTLLEILAAVGGTRALQAVAAAANEGHPDVRNAATRVLGVWASADAAPVLLEIARGDKEQRFRNRALRGYLRIVRQFSMPASKRAEMSTAALGVARRAADREQIFAILERYPSLETLQVAVDAANDPELKKAAAETSLKIAEKVAGSPEAVAELLARLGQAPVEIEIVRAVYGAGDAQKDVTELLRKHVGRLPLIALDGSYNERLGGDPAPGIRKKLVIEYRIDGKQGQATFQENATILLPTPE